MKIFVIILFLSLFACHESFNDSIDDEIEFRSQVTNESGIMTFTSEQSFKNYYNYLDSICSISEDPDSILNNIESSRSFVSYRALRYFDYVTEQELVSHYKKEYIHDIYMQSIFNAYAEYKIGNDYYTYLAPNRLYKIKNNDYLTLLNFRNHPRGDKNPPLSYYNENVEIVSDGDYILIGSGPGDSIGTRSPDVDVLYDFAPNPECGFETEKSFKAELVVLTSIGWEQLEGYWTITWGDGSVSTFDNVSEVETTHTWPDYWDEHDFEIYINYNHPVRGPETYIKQLSTIPIYRDCRWTEDFEIDNTYSGNRKMVSKIWFGDAALDNAIHAYTHCWKLDGNTYSRERGELDVTVNMTWFNGISQCGQVEDIESESDHCNNCKRIQAMKVHNNAGTYSPTIPPTSSHRLEDGGEIINDIQELNPCD